MDPTHDVEQASEQRHRGAGPGSLDFGLAAELGLFETLENVQRAIGRPDLPPAVARIRLAAAAGSDLVGNPVDWHGFEARSVAVYNPNNAFVWVGVGGGQGAQGRALVKAPGRTLTVLPLEGELFSFGMPAAQVANGDLQIVAFRFAHVLEPSVHLLGTGVGRTPLGYAQKNVAAVSTGLPAPPNPYSLADVTYSILTPATVDIRWRDDGTAPTAAIGYPLKVGSELAYDGDPLAFQMISVGAATNVDVTLYA